MIIDEHFVIWKALEWNYQAYEAYGDRGLDYLQRDFSLDQVLASLVRFVIPSPKIVLP